MVWATTGVLVKLIHLGDVSYIVFGRFVVAFAFLLGWGIKQGRAVLFFLNGVRRHGGMVLWLAVLMALYYITATWSFIYAPVAMASLIMSLSPSVTVLYKLWRREPVAGRELLGFVLSLLGVGIYLYPRLHLHGVDMSGLLLGGGLALGTAIVRACYSIILWNNRARINGEDMDGVNLLTYLVAAMAMLPVMGHAPVAPVLNGHNLILLLLLGVVSTALPNVFNNKASVCVSPTVHTIVGMTTPLLGSILAWLVLGEMLTIWTVMAIVVTLAGVCLAAIRTRS